MTALRRHFLAHRRAAAWLIAAALVMRILVPTGFMLAASPAGAPILVLCSGYGPLEPMAPTLHPASHDAPAAAHGAHHGPAHDEGHGAAKELPCAFAGVAAASLAATDPLLLAAALFFILAASFRRPRLLPVAARPYLRPPLRGPPATA